MGVYDEEYGFFLSDGVGRTGTFICLHSQLRAGGRFLEVGRPSAAVWRAQSGRVNLRAKRGKFFGGFFFHDQEAAHVASRASLKVIACTVALNAVQDRMQSARSASRSNQKLSRNCILIVIICRQKLCKKYSFDQTA